MWLLTTVLAMATVSGAIGAEFHPYPVGLMHQSSVAQAFAASENLLKADCEARCGSGCEGFVLIDGYCRQLIASPFHGGLAHHGDSLGLFRSESNTVHHVWRKTTDADFLSKEGIHDCKKNPCATGKAWENSCLVYGECVCKPNSIDPDQDTFIGATCSDTASECKSVLAELDRSAECPCGTRLETKVVDLSIEDSTMDVCVAQSPSAALAPISTLSDCASKYASTAKLERTTLISPVFRRMGAGTQCVASTGQAPGEGDKYSVSSPEECMQLTQSGAGFQYTATTDVSAKNCVVFNKVADVEYSTGGTSSCYLNSYFEYENGSKVRVLTHEKTIEVTSRVTTCLVSQQVTTGVDSLELALDRLNVIRTVAGSFAYRVSDGILVMQDQRLQNRLEDQLRFMDLALQEGSDFFCKTLCPCGTYTLSAGDTACTQRHETFRSGLEQVRAQMNCVFRPDWDSNDPLFVSVLLNGLTCAAFYRDQDSKFYESVLAEGRARASYALSKVTDSGLELHKLLPGAFVNSVSIVLESISSPLSSSSYSFSGAQALVERIKALETSTDAALSMLRSGSVISPSGQVSEPFREQAEKFDSDSREILQALTESRVKSADSTADLLRAVDNLNTTVYSTLLTAREAFQADLADYIERFPGFSPKFDKEIERSNAAFDVFQSLVQLVPFILRESARVGASGGLVLREVTPVSPGKTDLEQFRQTIVRFKFLSMREPSLVPVVDAMIQFHDKWQSLTSRNDGQVLDLDSTSSFGRLRELMISIASTASYNAFVMLYMARVVDTKHSDQEPSWMLSSSGTELLDGFLLRFSSLFVYDLDICPKPLSPDSDLSSESSLSALKERAPRQSGRDTGVLREVLKGKTSEVLYSCGKFHQELGKVVAQASLALGAAFDVISSAQNELRATQDVATDSSLSHFLDQALSLPQEARNPFLSLYFRDRFWQIQSRWARHMEKLCNVFKLSSADLLPGLSIGGTFSFNGKLCTVSTSNALSKNVVPGLLHAWDPDDAETYGPLVAVLNGDGSVTGFYNGTGRVGDMSTVEAQLQNVIQLRGNLGAFAALRSDGRVISWGSKYYGGDASTIPELESGVERLYETSDVSLGENEKYYMDQFATSFFFAAQKQDGSLVLWGGHEKYRVFEDVADIVIGQGAVAVIHANRTVTAWGVPQCGGDSSSVQDSLVDVEEVFLNAYDVQEGPNAYQYLFLQPSVPEEAYMMRMNFTCSFFEFTFWARKKDGSAVAWSSGNLHGADEPEAKALLSGGIAQLHPKFNAVLFIRGDGTAFTLGPESSPTSFNFTGGFGPGSRMIGINHVPTGADSSTVKDKLVHIRSVHPGLASYTLLRKDGSVVTWGANETEWGAGDSSSLADFLSRDILHIAGGFTNNCAVSQQAIIECWGKRLGSFRGQSFGVKTYEFDEVKDHLKDGVKLQANGQVEAYARTGSFLARRKLDGQLVHWGFQERFDSQGERILTATPDVSIKYVFWNSKSVLMEDGSLVSFDPDMEQRGPYEAVKHRLQDVSVVTSVSKPRYLGEYDLHIAEAPDGSLTAWGANGKGAVFDGRNIGSEMDSTNRLSAKVRVAENGLKGATGRWLIPAQSKQKEQLDFQPACRMSDSSMIASLLGDGVPQVLDVTVASLPRFCSGNVGVRSVAIKLHDASGKDLALTSTVKFKVQPAIGSVNFKYFPTSSKWVESMTQRSGQSSTDAYYVDVPQGDRTEKGTLADAGNILPSPYTKWLLSLETSWPEDVTLPSSISLVFALSGGVCHSEQVDATLIEFIGERAFFSQAGVESLALATTCGGMRLPTEAPESVTPTPSPNSIPVTSAPNSVPGGSPSSPSSNSEAASWVMPVAISGGVAALIALAVATVFLRLKNNRKAQQDDEILVAKPVEDDML